MKKSHPLQILTPMNELPEQIYRNNHFSLLNCMYIVYQILRITTREGDNSGLGYQWEEKGSKLLFYKRKRIPAQPAIPEESTILEKYSIINHVTLSCA